MTSCSFFLPFDTVVDKSLGMASLEDDLKHLSVYDPTDDFNLEEDVERAALVAAPPEKEF